GAVTGADLERFIDRDQIAAWAVPYIEKCLALRFINGMTANTFAPGDTATRGQAAAILKRIYIKIS
ncbi:MAG: S-layer homology domain-containing protein, partial [Clostridia bacterium]